MLFCRSSISVTRINSTLFFEKIPPIAEAPGSAFPLSSQGQAGSLGLDADVPCSEASAFSLGRLPALTQVNESNKKKN